MATATAEQVIVGKMPLPKTSGQISLFALPQGFAWLSHFSAEEIAQFLSELLTALNQSQQSGDWIFVSDVIEAWKATANIKADPSVGAGVKQGLSELSAGQGVSWMELREELDL